MTTWEIHQNLRGGEGIVNTYTTKLFKMRLIRMNLEARATIGNHTHDSDSEIYFTFNRNIRFCKSERWKFLNFCRKGSAHSAENLSWKKARIWAVKF